MTSESSFADYVIIGGGTAGAILAARLSEDPDVSVVLLEAGGGARSPIVQIPAGFAYMVGRPKYDWMYQQEPDASLEGAQRVWSNGRLLGGGSSINGQVYIRGTRRDYDRWAEAGATGWGFDDVWPYFLRHEDWCGEASPVHGARGPVSVAPVRDHHPLAGVFIDACREMGIPTLAEHNGGDMNGAFLSQTNQRKGLRCSTEKAYLRPARTRKNLRVMTQAHVTNIGVVKDRADHVDYVYGRTTKRIRAVRQVILCAGAIGSPALLMRSGIGPAAQLEQAGISVTFDKPGVGQNLQEHCHVGLVRGVNTPTLTSRLSPFTAVRYFGQFIRNRTGPIGSPAVQAMALAKTRQELEEPDIQLHFFPLGFDNGADFKLSATPAITLCASLAHPESRGRVIIDASGTPSIDHQLVGDTRDMKRLIDALKLIDSLYDTSAFKPYLAGGALALKPENDEQWTQLVRQSAALSYHPAGTCRMGSDANAVVDTQLCFNGIDGLRVVDASVMPLLPSTNTNAPVMMIAERAAEMIQKYT